MMMDSVVSWAVLAVGTFSAFVGFVHAFAASKPARHDYGTVESMKINLHWGE